jgi:uncharacterized repeat protein (TIGR01451 family)
MTKKYLILITAVLLLVLSTASLTLAQDEKPPDYPDSKAFESADGAMAYAPEALWPGPDGFGYLGSEPAYDWVEISSTGTEVLLADDNFGGPFPIGFTFNFYGTDYTDFYIASNGYISLGAGSSTLTNQCPLPNASTPNNIIPIMWDDLDPGDTSDPAYYQSFEAGACPYPGYAGACLVVQYEDYCHYPGGVDCLTAGTFEGILFDDHSIVIQFEDAGVEEGLSSTTGIENNNAAADWGLTYACNVAATITDGLAVQFIPPPPAPDLGESYKEAPELVEWGDPIHYTIEIVNTGELPALSTVLTDVIPYGTEYVADSLTCNLGICWYDEVANTVYWTGTVDAPPAPLIQSAYPPASPSGTPATNLLQFGESNVSGNPVTPASSITAAVLLDQPPNQSNGIFADASCDLCGGAQVLAENFVLGSSVNVGQIVFWTGYYPTDTPIDPDEITVIFHEDAGGLPGTAVYTESGVAYDRVQTGVILFGVHEWMHTLTLATPVALGPGTYWVEIYNDTGFGTDDMFWEVGDLDPANGIPGGAFTFEAPGSNWNFDPGLDLAIQIIAAPVIVEFDVQPLACGITVENEAVVYDPELIGGPVYLNASTDVIGSPFLEEDFELDDGGYVSVGANPWTWGPPPMGPAHSGVNAWSTESPYAPLADYRLESDWLDLTGAPANIELTWFQDIYIESASWDHAYVEITTDEMTYDILWSHTGGTYNSNGWEYKAADISAYAGQLVKLRFRMDSDSSVQYDGWAIDDVAVVIGCAPPDILVDAPPLHAYLVPTSTQTIPFDVCNLGESVLDWSVSELSPTMGIMNMPEDVLWDNGPFVTHPGGGFGGADASALQTALGMITYGFGHQYLLGYHVADDFTIPPGETWTIENIAFYAYQTGSGTISTITGVYLQIWDGPPDDLGSSIIWGDLVTNRMVDTTWTNSYRVLDTGLLDSSRPIMVSTAAVGIVLSEGTYWLDWNSDGTLASGPWVPPVTILGQTTTGNAKQYTTGWADLIDVGPQGLPFVIMGPAFDIPWLSEDPTAGSVFPSFCDMVDVMFDSTGMALGEYYGDLGVNSNDPDTPEITLPVTMTVDLPAIELVKTVGTDPEVCAETDSIQVLIGSEVAYCYTVTNLSEFATLPLHDLVDSELGILLEDVPYDLEPGMSFELIVTATVDVDTTNEATWTAFVNEEFFAEASDSATVDVLWPEIELNKTVGLDPNVCAETDSISVPVGTEVTYCFEVTNTGDETLVLHDLVDSELGALLEDFAYDLAPGASVFITETVAVMEDTVNTATWTAYMDENFFAEASDTATVTVYVEGYWIYLPLITRDTLP